MNSNFKVYDYFCEYKIISFYSIMTLHKHIKNHIKIKPCKVEFKIKMNEKIV